ncbi:hypothetical protein DA70_05715 [Pandoraea pnomenusa]|uniref:hypothetical protein n=1 Tax=Pandoraea pnomenusa TaxID=93220 RepID=UPI0004375712|nr:hypothetical protein [Pandoraea pnomenusa]AHN77337.1 hypothetical protein DA70_05715 [Pandoraea pnomenusa]
MITCAGSAGRVVPAMPPFLLPDRPLADARPSESNGHAEVDIEVQRVSFIQAAEACHAASAQGGAPIERIGDDTHAQLRALRLRARDAREAARTHDEMRVLIGGESKDGAHDRSSGKTPHEAVCLPPASGMSRASASVPDGATPPVVKPPGYACPVRSGVLLAHAASLGVQMVSVASPYLAPDVFAGLAGARVCERVRSSTTFAGRGGRCKVLRIGRAIFTPGMMVAPYFALLALGDLICWGVEFHRPGTLPFQGDSLANLMYWLNARGAFERVHAALGANDAAILAAVKRVRVLERMVAKLRTALVAHDDPVWQKALAARIRLLSTGVFVWLIARLPFSDDVSELPKGLSEFYQWLERLGAGTKLAAALSGSLVSSRPSAEADASLEDELVCVRVDPRDIAPTVEADSQ